MLINFQQACRKHRLRPKGVIHCGANIAQEHEEYIKAGVQNFIYIEPCVDAFYKLKDKFNGNEKVKLFNVACGNQSGEIMMNIETSNGGQSNSILTPAKHLTAHPDVKFIGTEIVDICRLDDLEFDRSLYDLLVMDCQGFEAEVLKGATETLKSINIVYTEVNTDELYENCAKINDIRALLPGFRKIELSMTHWGWGDAIFKRL